MADISLCEGEGCPEEKRSRCHRHTCPPDPLWQAYVPAMIQPDGTCENFWDNAAYRVKKRAKK